MTPMPNHLSTYRSLPLNHIRVVGMKGPHRDVEEKRLRSGVEGVWRGENGVHYDTNA